MTTVSSPLADALRDRYLLERELGHGGMATVYLAHDLKHDRPVAIKVLHPELAHALGPERFLREITITAQFDHPYILPLLDSGVVEAPTDNGRRLLYYVMPYVEGESLRDRMKRQKQLPLDDALQVTREVAEALAMPMPAVSFTAISSPRTSCSRAATRGWPISALREQSTPPAARSSPTPAWRSAPPPT